MKHWAKMGQAKKTSSNFFHAFSQYHKNVLDVRVTLITFPPRY